MNEFNEQQPDFTERQSSLKGTIKSITDFTGLMLKAFIFSAAFIMFVAQVSIVQGFSMEPNLHTNQRVIIDKLSYEFQEPARGDIVVIDELSSDVPLIKRIVGLPGETVEIRNNQVFINGEMLDEPYLGDISQTNYNPVIVPPEHVFVMGDNRMSSRDSRVFGSIDIYRIRGKVRLSIWPPGIIQ